MADLQDYAQLLTMEDVNNLKNNPSPSMRAAIADKVSTLYLMRKYKQRQNVIAEDICRILMFDSDTIVREALSNKLKDSDEVPTDIAVALATDKIDKVALPMLESSSVLGDKELVEIVSKTESTKRHVTISKRENVSEAVSDALVKVDNPTVIKSLLDNKSAKVSDESFETIMHKHVDDNTIAKRLAERSAVHFLSTEERSVEAAINNLIKKKKFTSSVIIEVLCMGNSSFFEMSLAKILRTNVTTIQNVLEKQGRKGFDKVYEKAKMPKLMNEAAYWVYSIVKEMEKNGEKTANKTLHNYLSVIHWRLKNITKTRKIESVAYIMAIIEQKILQANTNPSSDW